MGGSKRRRPRLSGVGGGIRAERSTRKYCSDTCRVRAFRGNAKRRLTQTTREASNVRESAPRCERGCLIARSDAGSARGSATGVLVPVGNIRRVDPNLPVTACSCQRKWQASGARPSAQDRVGVLLHDDREALVATPGRKNDSGCHAPTVPDWLTATTGASVAPERPEVMPLVANNPASFAAPPTRMPCDRCPTRSPAASRASSGVGNPTIERTVPSEIVQMCAFRYSNSPLVPPLGRRRLLTMATT